MLPCTKIIGFIEEGFMDLAEALSRVPLMTRMRAATALVLGCPFDRSQRARQFSDQLSALIGCSRPAAKKPAPGTPRF
jgi:hypothetical protein